MVCGARRVVQRSRDLTVARVLRDHAGAVRPGLPARQRRMLDSLLRCRTPALGGHLVSCASCGHRELRYHGCRDRHCPACAAGRTARWLIARQDKLLPAPHFQVVFTVPEAIRPLSRAMPRIVYGVLMREAVRTLQDVLADEHGARFAISSVLHTWTRELLLHPHVHCIVSSVGLSLDDARLVDVGERFLVSTRKLAPVFAARVLAGLRRELAEAGLIEPLASRVEPLLQRAAKDRWVLHITKPDGRGPEQILRYLARYLFRVAIDDRRLLAYDGERVVIRTRGGKTATLRGADFVRRFVQHALPKGFRKVRHSGLLAPSNVDRFRRTKQLLAERDGAGGADEEREPAPDPTIDPRSDREPRLRCPSCNKRTLERWPLPLVRGPPWAGAA